MGRGVRVVVGLASVASLLVGAQTAGALSAKAVTTKKKATKTTAKTTVKKATTTLKTGATPAPTTAAPTGPAVDVRETSLGKVLVDAKGRTLYAFLNDQATRPTSTCTDVCAKTWPPYVATANTPTVGTGLEAAKASSAPRPGGAERQVTYDGWPLYNFSGDQKPGDVFGQGTGGIWFVVASDGKPLSGSTAAPAAPAGTTAPAPPPPAGTTPTTAPASGGPTTVYVYGGY